MNIAATLLILGLGAVFCGGIGLFYNATGDGKNSRAWLKVFIMGIVLLALAAGFGTGTEGHVK